MFGLSSPKGYGKAAAAAVANLNRGVAAGYSENFKHLVFAENKRGKWEMK